VACNSQLGGERSMHWRTTNTPNISLSPITPYSTRYLSQDKRPPTLASTDAKFAGKRILALKTNLYRHRITTNISRIRARSVGGRLLGISLTQIGKRTGIHRLSWVSAPHFTLISACLVPHFLPPELGSVPSVPRLFSDFSNSSLSCECLSYNYLSAAAVDALGTWSC